MSRRHAVLLAASVVLAAAPSGHAATVPSRDATAAAPATAGEAPPTPAELADAEQRARTHLRRVFERVGRSAPVPEPALTGAARTLAREALLRAADAATGARITAAVSDAGGWDPSPRLVVIRSWPLETTLQAFLARTDLAGEPATHAGLAIVADGEHAVLAVLLGERKATLQAFPHRLEKAPARARLCFELRSPLAKPSVYVTRPAGSVDRLAVAGAPAGTGCVDVPFPVNGRHTVELLGEGPQGPEVAAMLFVDVGPQVAPVLTSGPASHAREPTGPGETRAVLLERVNALRTRSGAHALEPDARLDAIAQAYADRMVRERFFAHLAPAGDGVQERLEAGGYAYRTAGENLGLAAGPFAAHTAIEESPGHRKNLLDPAFQRIGFGMARQGRDGGGTEVILVEIMATPAPTLANPVDAAYARLASLRAAAGRPALVRSAALEAVALRQAQSALARDDPRAPDIQGQVFVALSEARSASAVLYVTTELGAIPPSQGLKDPRFSFVGVGAVRGDSPTYGPGRYWVVVILAGIR